MKTIITTITTFLLLLELNAQVCNTVQADFCYYTEGATTSFVFSGDASGVTSYLWSFGDGTTSTLANPIKTFTATGSFQACLTLTCIITTTTGGGYGGGGTTTTTTCSDFHCDNILISSSGCTDPVAVNYSSLATVDDGSCSYCVYGCIDPTASNYNSSATCDDNSCLDILSKHFCDDFESYDINDDLTYSSPVWGTWSNPMSFGCTEDVQVNNSPVDSAGNGGSNAIHFSSISSSGGPQDVVCPFGTSNSYNTGVFIFSADFNVDGSPHTGAYFNFQSDYNIGVGWALEVFMQQNGSITFSNNLNNNLLTGVFPLNTWFELSIAVNITNNQWNVYIDNLLIGSFSNPINQLALLDLFPLNGNSFWVDNVCYTYDHTLIYGCTDPAADNYDASATWNDGFCTYTVVSGCTDPAADNYDSSATQDDGSCTYSTTCSAGPITGLFIDGIIDDRVNANYDNMNTYDANGNQICRVDQIRIRYREVGTSAWSQKNIASPTGYDAVTGICNSTQSTMKPIRNLTLGTTYEWEVKVWYCSGGSGGWVAGPNFTTAGECPNVGNLAVVSNNPTKATFTWDDSNGAYKFARIKVRVDTIAFPAASDWFLVGGFGVMYPTFTKQKNGLTPGETYRGQARTWCDPNGGAYNALSWTPLVTWTQPTNRIEGGTAITNLDVYPNPSRDVFNITFTSESIQDLRVRVLNVVGEEVVLEHLEEFVGEYTKSIDLAAYTKGVYFLDITTNTGVVNKKIILQ